LEAEGAEVALAPILEIAPAEDQGPLRSAAESLSRYAWILFASPAAVTALVDAARRAGTLALLKKARIAAVGSQTAQAANDAGLTVSREAQTSTGPGLYEAIRDALVPGDEILLPAAQEGRLELFTALQSAGAKVTRVAAYRSEKKTLAANALADLEEFAPRLVIFASPRTAEAFVESAGERGRKLLSKADVIAIGPTTAGALAAMRVHVCQIAEEPTSSALVAAAVRAVRG
jgi:uroporphyrinogen-III synthase